MVYAKTAKEKTKNAKSYFPKQYINPSIAPTINIFSITAGLLTIALPSS